MYPASSLKTPHYPKNNRRNRLFIQCLDQSNEGREKRRYNYPGQHQGVPSQASLYPAENNHQGQSTQGSHECQQWNDTQPQVGGSPQSQSKSQGCSKGGTAGNTNGERISQWIPQDSLENNSGHPQGRSHQKRKNHPTQTNVKDHHQGSAFH